MSSSRSLSTFLTLISLFRAGAVADDRRETLTNRSLKSFEINSFISPVEKLPTTEVIKSMYPLYDNENNFTAWITILLKITCFGKSVTQTITVPTDVLTTKQELMPAPVITPYQVVEENDSLKSDPCPMEERCPCEKTSKVDYFNGSFSSESLDSCRAACKDAALYPSPVESCSRAVSADNNNFEEYQAEINDNKLIIRIAKDAHLRAEMVTMNQRDGCTETHDKNSTLLADFLQTTYDKFLRNLSDNDQIRRKQKRHGTYRPPVVRGNLKYPAIVSQVEPKCYTNNFQENLLEKLRLGNEKQRNVCAQIYAGEIEKTITTAPSTRPPLHMQKVLTASDKVVNGTNGNNKETRQSMGGGCTNTSQQINKCPPGLEVNTRNLFEILFNSI